MMKVKNRLTKGKRKREKGSGDGGLLVESERERKDKEAGETKNFLSTLQSGLCM